MTSRVTRAAEAPSYFPPLHVGVNARRLHGHEAGPTDAFWVGLSVYGPGATAQRSATSQETVYVVLDGQLVLTTWEQDRGTATVLSSGDSVHLPRGTARSVENASSSDARLLVVIAQPQPQAPKP
jgi:quercetin dioxygenase-like cupin family protein